MMEVREGLVGLLSACSRMQGDLLDVENGVHGKWGHMKMGSDQI
jgi:hypothetical protein